MDKWLFYDSKELPLCATLSMSRRVNYDIKCATLSQAPTDIGIAFACCSTPHPIKCSVAKSPTTTDVYFFIYPMLGSILLWHWLLQQAICFSTHLGEWCEEMWLQSFIFNCHSQLNIMLAFLWIVLIIFLIICPSSLSLLFPVSLPSSQL